MKDFSTKVFFIYTRESGKALAYFDESISLAQTHTLSLVPSLLLYSDADSFDALFSLSLSVCVFFSLSDV